MNFLPYENDYKGVQIKYPNDWDILEKSPNPVAIFLSPYKGEKDLVRENLNIVIHSVEFAGLRNYVEKYVERVEKYNAKFTLLEKNFFTHQDLDAANLVFEALNSVIEDTMMRYRVMIVMDVDNIYELTFSAHRKKYDEYIPVIRNMMESFKIIR